MEWINPAMDKFWLAGCCENGSAPVTSIKCREFFLLAEELLAFQEGLWPLELVEFVHKNMLLKVIIKV
jgi:hypothetical protein